MLNAESSYPSVRSDRPSLGALVDARRVAFAALLSLPAALTAYFAFNSGGFHPGPPAYAAIVLCVVLLLRVALAGNPFEGFSVPLAVAIAAAINLL